MNESGGAPIESDIKDFTPAVSTSMDMMDFTETGRDVVFRLNGDVFYGVTEMPVEDALSFTELAQRLDDKELSVSEKISVMKDIIRLLLRPESADLFIARLSDKTKPIGVKTLLKVIPWLFEQYGLRPTKPGSDSSPGSDNPVSGTVSTASTSGEA